ncbi:MAG: hypothetical protein A6F72_08220 [Cycloclasticus sp. symbiont of Poecilosclerida sp. N]|nr:MAG: hypothetical protein A6F72_08220 [Cycloclasticus sp. symbiont of Poecilosclerida sp. N]
MARYIQTGVRKVIGAFAGVGALVEDIKGVVKIREFDKWDFYQKWDENNYIKDNRLLQRLKDKGFPKLKTLIKAPTNQANSYANPQYIRPTNTDNVINAEYFPKWMFCGKCHRFKHLKDWWEKWEKVIKQYDSAPLVKARDSFVPPKCGYCYEQARINKKGNRYHELTQTRFIMTSSDGKISDVPWDKWLTFKQQAKHEDDKTIDFGDWNKCCDKQDLYYKQGDFEDLSGINITCKNCNKRSSLVGLYGLSYASGKDKQYRYKMAIRSSNSVYYPILVHSLYLPSASDIDENSQLKIDGWLKKNKDTNFMFDALEEKYSENEIQDYINSKEASTAQKEVTYRQKEYQFILKSPDLSKDDFIFKHQTIDNLDNSISHLVQISRLKMTTVQTGYTRQEPLDIDLFLDGKTDRIKPQYTSSQAQNTEYLLGIENFGEGIFITFNQQKINNYIEKRRERLNKIFQQSEGSALFKNKFSDAKHLAKFIFVHTVSHLLMKELEFSCGYPTASLSERLFVDNNDMQAVLIYTVGGMEGGYGGLASQANPHKFKQLLDNALERAENCASDPICYHSDGQGVSEMNLAACYSCALIADNACESFNSFLDRQSCAE